VYAQAETIVIAKSRIVITRIDSFLIWIQKNDIYRDSECQPDQINDGNRSSNGVSK